MFRQTSVFLLILAGVGLLLGCDSTTPAGPDDDLVIILMTGMDGDQAFDPAVATVQVGQSVAWKNNDTITHRAILSTVFDSKQLPSGATSAATEMTTPNTYEYKCTIHPSEIGTIVVTP